MSNELMVSPICTPAEAKTQWLQYQEMFKSITDEHDVINIQGNAYKTKSFWRKTARFFGLSVEIREEKREMLDGAVVYSFTHRASTKNGLYADGTGACDSSEFGEKNPFSEHKCRSKAETRSFNRAVSNLVGAGETSAEEADEGEVKKPISRPEGKRPAWSLGECPKCGSDLSKGQKDPTTFYCTNWNGKKTGTPCDFPGKGNGSLEKMAETIAAYNAQHKAVEAEVVS